MTGEIYPEVRGIVFKYEPLEKYFLLRFYLDREPTEKDEEIASVVLSEFISNFSYKEFEIIESECKLSLLYPKDIDVLDGVVYWRKEYFD